MVFSYITSALETLHDQSLPTIELLQTSFPNNKNFMINISTLFDPRYVFLIYAPILFALNKRVGHRTIFALTLTEWANQVLKWLLAGERPYWYVHERANELQQAGVNAASINSTGIESYDMASILNMDTLNQPTLDIRLKQFPVTCELGAGSPSGHAMVTATVWYILIDAYLKGELPLFTRAPNHHHHHHQITSTSIDHQQPPPPPRSGLNSFTSVLAKLAWIIYGTMLLMVSLSRVYLACHFPHQCLCGAALGVLVARFVAEWVPMERMNRKHFCLLTCFMFASALGTYAFLRSMGLNPMWSVDKGMRWCVKKEYIHLDTTPFFSMMRYLGFCLGAGLAYDGSKMLRRKQKGQFLMEEESQEGHLLVIRRFAASLAAILFGQLLMSLPIPKTNLNLFYVISFLIYTLFSYAIASPIPQLTKLTFASPASSPLTERRKFKSH